MFTRIQMPFRITRKKKPTTGYYYQGRRGEMIRHKNQSQGKKSYQKYLDRYKY